MEARKDKCGLYLIQTAYVHQLLKRGDMFNTKLIYTPVSIGKPLYADDSVSSSKLQQSHIGRLLNEYYDILKDMQTWTVCCRVWCVLGQESSGITV
ncbi:hypothetical protein Scep_000017 [Stephania cephalantha]|uniref:Uncharacterized protein n=1 Tax=Stephania cephalantha TaxID=152367 RepID=A0AAP0L5K3_9MAGN